MMCFLYVQSDYYKDIVFILLRIYANGYMNLLDISPSLFFLNRQH